MSEINKPKRNQRMIYISQYLTDHPGKLIKLAYFMDFLQAAKSSISEDIDVIKEWFKEFDLGEIQTIHGAAGGVVYYPKFSLQTQERILKDIVERLSQGKRILQGNYIYMSDILQDSDLLNRIGQLIASRYADLQIDAVMTVETQGIGLAVSVARYLNVPYIIVRRDSTDTMGSTISVNYISGSHQTVKKMELSKDSLRANSQVLIVDDFLRNGGTIQGMVALLEEFDSQAVGICVLGENRMPYNENLPNYQALVNVELKYHKEKQQYQLDIHKGSFFG